MARSRAILRQRGLLFWRLAALLRRMTLPARGRPLGAFLPVLAFLIGGVLVAPAQQTGPWRMDELKQAPAMRWISRDGPVHSLMYAGETYQGHPTEVFAFFASPATLGEAKPGAKFPGVILVHGGGGTAFVEWAWLWAKRGYAVIAMDLGGSQPPPARYDAKTGAPVAYQASNPKTYSRLPNGGPPQEHPQKFGSIGGPVTDQWVFHAVASVIRAHSLLRGFPEVDAAHTALTGISWGGFTTCLVASLDDRFQAAVPVYGCGFIHEGESVQKSEIDKLGERRQQWIDACDPSSWLGRCRVPILFVNGTNDVHYPLDSYQKSYDRVPGKKQIRIQDHMPHGHGVGWAPVEIGIFIDSYCRGGAPLAVPGNPLIAGGQVSVTYTARVALKEAALHFTTDTGLRSKRAWQSVPATIGSDSVTAPKPPADANTWFLSLTDERGAMVTTPVHFE